MTIITLVSKVTTDESTETILMDAMACATKVYNGLIRHLREQYKETGSSPVTRKNLNKIIKLLPRRLGYYFLFTQATRGLWSGWDADPNRNIRQWRGLAIQRERDQVSQTVLAENSSSGETTCSRTTKITPFSLDRAEGIPSGPSPTAHHHEWLCIALTMQVSTESWSANCMVFK